MSLAAIGWLFTLGVLAHNTEEALRLPAWSEQVGKWYPPVGARAFRFAAIALSVLFVLNTATASFSEAGGIAAYLMAGYVLAMVLNAFVPHVLVTVLTRKYMPGTATAILLNLPLGSLYLQKALSEEHISLRVFYWAGPLVVLSILALLPVLLALGRRLHPTTG
jgi:hypothetical protein